MKKNNILPIFIIIFDLLVILLSKNFFRRKVNSQINLYNFITTSKRANRRSHSYKRHILTKRNGRNIHSNSSNDEILELIKQFLGGKKR